MNVRETTGFPVMINAPSVASYSSRKTAHRVCLALALSAIGCLATGIAIGSVGLLAAAAGCALAISVILALRPAKGILFQKTSRNHPERIPSQPPNTELLARSCADTRESFRWKKHLVRLAQKEVILSGNYIGGDALDEVLTLLEEKLATIPDFRACILGSDLFVNESNHLNLDRLKNQYGDRFLWVKTESYTHNQEGERAKKANNHVKGLVIDGGRMMLMGGSGLENKYAYSDGLKKDSGAGPGGIVNFVIARNFRDMDWVFARPLMQKSKASRQTMREDMGSRLRNELLQLAQLYQGINRAQGEPQEIVDVIERFPVPEGDCLYSRKKDLVGLEHSCRLDVWAQGPTDERSKYSQKLAALINSAQQRIVIHHQFFNPSDEVTDALRRAMVERNVEVIVTTNFDNAGKDSPMAHRVFVPANRARLAALARRLTPAARARLTVYEFGGKGSKADLPRKATLHKKVCVIDSQYVLAGSSNLGHKSMVSSADYEVNFIAESRELAAQTESQLAVDRMTALPNGQRLPSGLKQHAQIWDPMQKLSLRERIMGWFYLTWLAEEIN